MLKFVVFAATLLLTARAIPVDNGVAGEPEIECGPTEITVNFNTRNEFEGQVYVKGLFAEDACINRGDPGRRVAGITLPFDTCNTRRQRSLNPKGVFVSTTVIVSFHPLFITKVDRAYKVQCFYMEADKTVSTDLEVSMLTTDFRTQNVPMPICRYELFVAGTNDIVQFALVGDPIDHRWTCDTETVDTFCMIVHSCYVDDTNGDRVDLLNEAGCALDRYLLNNPDYSTDLGAQVEAHVFKYADRPQLYFECQITILVKEPNDVCPRPACPEPAGRGAGGANPREGPPPLPPRHPFPIGPGPYSNLAEVYGEPRIPQLGASVSGNVRPRPLGIRDPRGKRSIADAPKAAGTMDVAVDLDTLEVNQNVAVTDFAHRAPHPKHTPILLSSSDYCISSGTVVTYGVLGGVLFVSFISAAVFVLFRRKA